MLWMTENFEWHDMTAGGILFVDHVWKKKSIERYDLPSNTNDLIQKPHLKFLLLMMAHSFCRVNTLPLKIPQANKSN
jgi:hypothetical protein